MVETLLTLSSPLSTEGDEMQDLTANEVRAFRKQIGQSQAGLAKTLGITPQGVEKWEKQGAPAHWRYAFAALAAGLEPWKP